MSKRRKWIIFGVGAIAVIAVTALLTRERQPQYEGRPLSEWLALYAERRGKFGPGQDDEKPGEVLRQMGTNALPCLLDWLDYEPAAWKLKLGAASQKLPAAIGRSRPMQTLWRLVWGAAQARSENAREAFVALGPMAAPAIPELTRRVNLINSPARRNAAMFALACIGPEALPVLKEVVAGFDSGDCLWITACIQRMGTNARPLVPILIPHLQSTNWFAAMIATRTLGQLGLEPGLVVPALTHCMTDSRFEIRMETPGALKQFGDLARPAIPALITALSDTNADVRRNAAEALEAIAPGVLTNAPAH